MLATNVAFLKPFLPYLGYGELLYSHSLDTGSGPKSSFQIKVNSAFHLEFKVPESLGKMERHRIPR